MRKSRDKSRLFYNPKNVKKALKMLKIVTDILEKNGIEYYLDFGTLLGAVREKGFIKWDHDLDISLVNPKDFDKIPKILKELRLKHFYRGYIYNFEESLNRIKKSRLERGETFKEVKVDFADKKSYQIAKIRTNKFLIFGKGHLCLDIFFKYLKDEKLYWMAFGSIYSTSVKPLKDGFEKIELYGYSFKIPKNYSEYLSNIYGDWQTPKEKWEQSEHKALAVNNLGI